MDEPECPGCRELARRVAALEAQNSELTRKLNEALRAGKRQAAPFRKGPAKAQPKTPGRKAGDQHGAHGHRPPPPPDQIHERHEAKLPDDCPHCHGPLVETGTAEQFQTEIPRTPIHRKFTVHLGRCECCGKAVQGRHELQTSDALGAAASQIGAETLNVPQSRINAEKSATAVRMTRELVTLVLEVAVGSERLGALWPPPIRRSLTPVGA